MRSTKRESTLNNTVGVDIETQDNSIWCVGVADGEHRTAFRDVNKALAYIGDRTPVFHNGKFDLAYLDADGSRFGNDWRDSMMTAHFLGYRPLNLPDLTSIFLTGTPLDKTVIKERKKVRFDERASVVLDVCSMDAWASDALHHVFEQDMAPYAKVYAKERKITRVLLSMERTGLPLSTPKVKQAMTLVMWKMGAAEVRLRAQGIQEPGNTEAIGQKFWRGKKRIMTTKKSGKLSTTAAHLTEFAKGDAEKKWVADLIEWRQMDKFRGTYLKSWLGKERLHADIKQWLATWRFSCSNPNLQNITKSKIVPLYQLFVAPPGWTFISADYSQIELRVLANIVRDPAMIQAYLSGSDMHMATIETTPKLLAMWNIGDPVVMDRARTLAKNINFGIAYKITKFGLAPRIWDTEDVAQNYIDHFYDKYRDVAPWQESQVKLAKETGHVLTMEGRPLWVPGIYADGGHLGHHADKQTSNFPVQGGAAEIVKNAMLRCPQYLAMQVHDELLYLVPEHLADDYYHFLEENLVDYSDEVPYTITIKKGQTWGDIKKIPDVFEDEEDD